MPGHPFRGSRVYTQKLGYQTSGQRGMHTLLAAGGYRAQTTLHHNAFQRLDFLTDPSGLGSTELTYNASGFNTRRAAPGLLVNAGTSGAHAPSGLVYHDSTLTRLYAHEPKTGFVSDRIRADSGRGLRYTYDARHQLWKVQAYTVANAATLCNGVDPATGEISSQCIRQNVVSQHTFTYDIHGNRTDLSAVNMWNNQQTAFDGMTFTYDYDGNLTEKRLKDGRYLRFTWSADNQLTGITRYATDNATVQEVFTYTYDGFGRRIRKSSSVASTGSHEYLHDGDHLVAEVDSLGGVIAQYTYYPGVDVPHSVAYNGHTYYVATEAPGSVSALTTEAGVVAASWDYDPWGVPTITRGANANGRDSLPIALRFAAREYDAETGLYYNRARYYDPQTGRFISEDPLGLAGGVNPYTYAGNNPINATDPSGLKWVCAEFSDRTVCIWELDRIYVTATGGGSGGGWGFAPRPGGLINSLQSWNDAVALLSDWAYGAGPKHRVFGEGSRQVDDLRSSPGVNAARVIACGKMAAGRSPMTTNVRMNFTPLDILRTRFNATRQFVGSYRVDISNARGGQMRIAVTNTTSLKSALYHIPFVPEYERSSWGPGGNMTQTFSWLEAVSECGSWSYVRTDGCYSQESAAHS